MPVPKRKTCKWKRDQRRAHIKLATKATMKCDNCGEMKRPHRVCDACGHYKSVEVVAKKS